MIKNEKGFTLIELMLATVIVVISIIPITMMLPRMLTENRIVDRENRAVFLGQKIMEDMKIKALTYFKYDWPSMPPPDGPGGKIPTAFPPPYNIPPYNIFKYSVTYTAGTDPNIKKITVKVWYDANNNNIADTGEEWIQLKTLITNRGEGV